VEETGKKRLAAAAVVAVGVVYFLVCAQPLGKEYVLAPVWARETAKAPQAPAASGPAAAARIAAQGKVFPFRLGGSYGYFDEAGSILFSAPAPYGVALAGDAFAAYERLSEGFSIRSPSGAELAKCALPGYPFFDSGRRFVLSPDQCSVAELGQDGLAIWKRQFGSVITAFGGSPSLAVFGLMDGSLVGVGRKGEELLSFAPGGSRLAGVYGAAVSPDGLLVAAVCGLDKQRLVVLEKRSSAYRVTYHRWLESDFRRPIAMAFTADGRRLVYEAPAGAGVWERDSRREFLVSASSVGRVGASLEGNRMLVLLAGAGEEKRLICASPDDRRLVDLPLRASDAFLEVSGRSIFVGADGDLVRLDLRRE
jgi:hypothetical protein